MSLHIVDLAIILVYILATIFLGIYVSKKSSKNLQDYFLGGNKLPWYYLGLSNASGMFDISGTMWMVYLLFVYGLKSVFIPWLWPVFNQIFLMIFLAIWLRRSGVMTGAEWIRFRFGNNRGATWSHHIIVLFAICNVIGFLAYGFIGIGKFAAVFIPWQLHSDPHWNEIIYGLIITAATTLYVVKGGMISVVFTELLQFAIMTIASIMVGIIAMSRITPEMLAKVVPDGWSSIFFDWNLKLDWTNILPAANEKIIEDGWSVFGFFFMMVTTKGIILSMAGPAPNYDMQRVLSAKTPKEAAKMSGFVNVVLLFPRYMLITGLTVLALVFFFPELQKMGSDVDFELILPFALQNYIPVGLAGLLIAGLLSAFMSTFSATVNAAPAYLVNDVYKRYINPNATDKKYIYLSYVVSVAVVLVGVVIGLFTPSLNSIIQWIVSGLYGSYAASNFLKWYWWRLNGNGYFAGMAVGLLVAGLLPYLAPDVDTLMGFFVIFLISGIASVNVSLLTPHDSMVTLKAFYVKTRPWGFWKPVYLEALKDDPSLSVNKDFKRDMFNVLIGIVWQTSITASPIFLVIKDYDKFIIALLIVAICTFILKKTWYDRLSDQPAESPLSS